VSSIGAEHWSRLSAQHPTTPQNEPVKSLSTAAESRANAASTTTTTADTDIAKVISANGPATKLLRRDPSDAFEHVTRDRGSRRKNHPAALNPNGDVRRKTNVRKSSCDDNIRLIEYYRRGLGGAVTLLENRVRIDLIHVFVENHRAAACNVCG